MILWIDSGAEIAGSPDIKDYKCGKYSLMWNRRLQWASRDDSSVRALITADDEKNIGIEDAGREDL